VRRGGPLVFAFVTAALAGLPPACSSPADLRGEGGSCSQATDCQEGLVCVPQPDGTRKCSSDLTPIQSTEDASVASKDGAATDGAAKDGAAKDGAQGDAAGDGSSPPQDGGPPPQDTGSPPQDTGTPPQDTGSPPQDSGVGGGDAAGD
jgi:hypothetical protein